MIWYLLLIFACYLAGSWMTYTPWFRDSDRYPLSFIVISVVMATAWVYASRTTNQRGLLTMSAVCDTAMILAYYVLPLIAFGVRANGLTVLGVLLIVAGAVSVKFGES